MKNVQVKDVPDDVHQILRARAAAEGKSLQEYLLSKLTSDARKPTTNEVLLRAGQRSGGSLTLDAATELLREDRDA